MSRFENDVIMQGILVQSSNQEQQRMEQMRHDAGSISPGETTEIRLNLDAGE